MYTTIHHHRFQRMRPANDAQRSALLAVICTGAELVGVITGVVPRAEPVGYAIDPNRVMSATPSTPIGAVNGVGDRLAILSVA
jgi:hypothetical protein